MVVQIRIWLLVTQLRNAKAPRLRSRAVRRVDAQRAGWFSLFSLKANQYKPPRQLRCHPSLAGGEPLHLSVAKQLLFVKPFDKNGNLK